MDPLEIFLHLRCPFLSSKLGYVDHVSTYFCSMLQNKEVKLKGKSMKEEELQKFILNMTP
jgi:hypothetical protein